MHSRRMVRLQFRLYFFSLFVLFFVFLAIPPPLAGAEAEGADFPAEAVKGGIKDLSLNPDSEKRVAAAELLGYHATHESIKALAAALVADQDPGVRNMAADSLWKLGKKAIPAQKSLYAALRDPHPGVRTSASWALQVQGVEPGKLAGTRRSVLTDPQSGEGDRFWAAKGLIHFDPPATLVDPILQYAKNHIRSKPAESALRDLAGRQDRSIIKAMTEMVGAYHRGNALILGGLEEFTPKVENLVQLICQQFSYNNNELTAAALILLEKHTEDAGEVSAWLPLAKPLTADQDQTVRVHAVRLIGRAGGLAYDALPELIQVLRRENDPQLLQAAIEAIAGMGDRTRPFPGEVITGVADKAAGELSRIIKNDPEQQTRLSAVRALDKLKTDPATTVPIFTAAALSDEYTLVRMSALQALGSRGKDAEAALPDLKKLLAHPDESTRQNAQWAIEAIEKGEVPADRELQPATGKEGKGQDQAMTALRTEGATFDERGFLLALNSFDIEKVKAFLDAGVPVNYRFASVHDKPVLSAVFDNTSMYGMQQQPTPPEVKELVKLLLARGADPNLTDKRGNTPLMMAAMGCDAELLQMLLDGGADLHAKSADGLTAIEFTISFANKGADALIRAGARLPADKVESYKQSFADNPAALELIERASAR
jgi:HEAT repeat protein